MPITVTAFEHSPDGGQGLSRDMRVRWALEEVDQPYAVHLVSFRAMKEGAHLALLIEPESFRPSEQSERGPEPIITVLSVSLGLRPNLPVWWLWIPGSRLRRAPE